MLVSEPEIACQAVGGGSDVVRRRRTSMPRVPPAIRWRPAPGGNICTGNHVHKGRGPRRRTRRCPSRCRRTAAPLSRLTTRIGSRQTPGIGVPLVGIGPCGERWSAGNSCGLTPNRLGHPHLQSLPRRTPPLSGAPCCARGCRNEKKNKKLGVSNTPYDGGWWVTDGSWWVTDGSWWVTDDGWWVTDGSWRETAGGNMRT